MITPSTTDTKNPMAKFVRLNHRCSQMEPFANSSYPFAMILLNGGKKKGLRISKRVDSSQARKKRTTPMTPSQFDIKAREPCHQRLVVSGFDSSTETTSKASRSCLAVSGSSQLGAMTLIAGAGDCQAGAMRGVHCAIPNFRFQISDFNIPESKFWNLRFVIWNNERSPATLVIPSVSF